eukprot:Hpha_TRINITY_DN36438_c0_g1::TRINITY_DN36438_c0_g1_i1::g.20075::m.20075
MAGSKDAVGNKAADRAGTEVAGEKSVVGEAVGNRKDGSKRDTVVETDAASEAAGEGTAKEVADTAAEGIVKGTEPVPKRRREFLELGVPPSAPATILRTFARPSGSELLGRMRNFFDNIRDAPEAQSIEGGEAAAGDSAEVVEMTLALGDVVSADTVAGASTPSSLGGVLLPGARTEAWSEAMRSDQGIALTRMALALMDGGDAILDSSESESDSSAEDAGE